MTQSGHKLFSPNVTNPTFDLDAMCHDPETQLVPHQGVEDGPNEDGGGKLIAPLRMASAAMRRRSAYGLDQVPSPRP